MAEITTLSMGDMLANTYEPKRKFRWILQWQGLDAFTCRSFVRPHAVVETTEIHYINTVRWVANKQKWQPMQLTLNDPIAPSAAQKVMEWVRLCYEQETGRAGYADWYKQELGLRMLDPVGAVVESWKLKGAFITDANFGDLDYNVMDPAQVSITIQPDRCILEY
jgi:hypothetical protein